MPPRPFVSTWALDDVLITSDLRGAKSVDDFEVLCAARAPAFRSLEVLHLPGADEVDEASRARLEALPSLSDLMIDWDLLL